LYNIDHQYKNLRRKFKITAIFDGKDFLHKNLETSIIT